MMVGFLAWFPGTDRLCVVSPALPSFPCSFFSSFFLSFLLSVDGLLFSFPGGDGGLVMVVWRLDTLIKAPSNGSLRKALNLCSSLLCIRNEQSLIEYRVFCAVTAREFASFVLCAVRGVGCNTEAKWLNCVVGIWEIGREARAGWDMRLWEWGTRKDGFAEKWAKRYTWESGDWAALKRSVTSARG